MGRSPKRAARRQSKGELPGGKLVRDGYNRRSATICGSTSHGPHAGGDDGRLRSSTPASPPIQRRDRPPTSLSLLAAELVQVVPAVQPRVVAIVEADAHGIVAHGLQRQDRHVPLAGHDLFLPPRPWPWTSALGDSTRRYSAARTKLSPLSYSTVSVGLPASSTPQLGRPRTRASRLIAHFASRSASVSWRASPASMIGTPARMG